MSPASKAAYDRTVGHAARPGTAVRVCYEGAPTMQFQTRLCSCVVNEGRGAIPPTSNTAYESTMGLAAQPLAVLKLRHVMPKCIQGSCCYTCLDPKNLQCNRGPWLRGGRETSLPGEMGGSEPVPAGAKCQAFERAGPNIDHLRVRGDIMVDALLSPPVLGHEMLFWLRRCLAPSLGPGGAGGGRQRGLQDGVRALR
jgi:hypothetical protein